MKDVDLDKIDSQLLDLIQMDARTPITELASSTSISTASVQRRLRRLRMNGIINREVALVDPVKAGFGITAVISVELERDKADLISQFRKKVIAERQIQQCYCVAGDADFVLIVIARNMSDYENFTNRFFLSHSVVRKFRSSIVVSYVKSDTFVPTAEPLGVGS